MGSAKSSGPPNARRSRAQLWRGPIVSKSPSTKLAAPAAAFGEAFPVFLAVEEVTKHRLCGGRRSYALKTRPRFSSIWLLNFRKRSSPSPRISVRHSPTGAATILRKPGGGQFSPLCGRLPRQRDRPHCDNSSLSKAGRAEEALARRRNPIAKAGPLLRPLLPQPDSGYRRRILPPEAAEFGRFCP